jgi:hypothetical protein
MLPYSLNLCHFLLITLVYYCYFNRPCCFFISLHLKRLLYNSLVVNVENPCSSYSALDFDLPWKSLLHVAHLLHRFFHHCHRSVSLQITTRRSHQGRFSKMKTALSINPASKACRGLEKFLTSFKFSGVLSKVRGSNVIDTHWKMGKSRFHQGTTEARKRSAGEAQQAA